MITNNIIYAAGVLFYSKSIDQTPYFLLGKDFDNKWSNFGGRCELIDRHDAEITASREAWEETIGAIYDYDNIRSVVKNKNTKCIVSKTPSGNPYYMYLVKIPFSSAYRDRFTSTKKFIANLPVDKKFLEMTDIKWVSVHTIRYSLDNKKKSVIRLRNIFEQTLSISIDNILTLID